ncbi:uncharacterized protein LOC141850522 [Brevipalpus obovatus]|uniref:uncharacterized protein LOC141850522 n=1 Tax=Brevipalpus obovatus TaxID=246614 RepID=UPI003D9F8BA0
MSTSSRRAFGNVSNVKSSQINIERNKLTSIKVSHVDQDCSDLKLEKSEVVKSTGKKKLNISSDKKNAHKERKNIEPKKCMKLEPENGYSIGKDLPDITEELDECHPSHHSEIEEPDFFPLYEIYDYDQSPIEIMTPERRISPEPFDFDCL